MQSARDALLFHGVEILAQEPPGVIIIVDPLARRVRETEAHVMLLVESSERDKVATATAHQPLVPACANGRLSSRTTSYRNTLEADTAPLQILIRGESLWPP